MRYRPVGWRLDSFRHSLAARGISVKARKIPIEETVAGGKYNMPTSIATAAEGKYGWSDKNLPESEPKLGSVLPGSTGFVPGYPIKNGVMEGRIMFHGEVLDPYDKERVIQFFKEQGQFTDEQLADENFFEDKYNGFIVKYEEEYEKAMKKVKQKYKTSGVIPRVSTLAGDPMLVAYDQFYLMPYDQQGVFINRMINRLGLDDGMMRHLRYAKDPVAEFKRLPKDAQNEYFDKMWTADMNDTSQGVDENGIPRQVSMLEDSGRVLVEEVETTAFGKTPEISEKGHDISFRKDIYPLGGFERVVKYQGDVDFEEQRDIAEQQYNQLLEKGGTLKDFGGKLPELSKFLSPLALDARMAADKKRYYQLMVAEAVNGLKDLKKQGSVTDDQYDNLMGNLEETWRNVTTFSNNVINANKRAQVKWLEEKKLELATMGGGSPAVRSITAKIGTLASLPDAQFFQKSQDLKRAVTESDLAKSLSADKRAQLMNQINYQETNRKIAIGRAREKEGPVRRVRGSGGINEAVMSRDVDAIMRIIRRMKGGRK